MSTLIVQVLIIIQGVLQAVKSATASVEVHVADGIGLLGTSSSLVFSSIWLENASAIVVIVLLFYWAACGVLEVLMLLVYFHADPQLMLNSDVRFILGLFLLVTYTTLVFLECFILACQVGYGLST